MNRISGIFVALLLIVSIGYAQPSKVTSGVIALDNGDLGAAIEKLTTGLADQSAFTKGKAKKVPKGYYYLHKAFLQLVESQDTTLADLKAQHPDALDKSVDYYKKATENPNYGGTWKKQATLDNSEARLWSAAFNEGVAYFNADGKEKEALRYFEMARDMNPDDFITLRMLGAAYITQADTASTLTTLENGLKAYNETYENAETGAVMKATPAYERDFGQLNYVYQQLAVIYNDQGEARKALDILDEGLALKPEADDLKRRQLDIYQKNPELFTEAVSKFEMAIADSPEDNGLKLAFASLLERNEKAEEAFKLYEAVYKANPEDIQANYGVGAYYINKAALLSKEQMEATKEAKIDELSAQIKELLKSAYPYMQFLHKAQPEVTEWLRQLVQISGQIGEDDAMMEYSTKLRTLNE